MTNRPETPGSSDEYRAGWAIRDAAPSSTHAQMLFDQVVDLLGDRAWVETWNDGARRSLYRREADSDWIVPWPILTVTRGGRDGPEPMPTDVPGVFAVPQPRPGRGPRVRGSGSGELIVRDGPYQVTIAYGADGRWFECLHTRSREGLADVVEALARGTAAPVELLATWVASRDVGRHGPGRVHLPQAVPQGAAGAWSCGLRGLREQLFRGRIEPGSGWLATDGWTGTAFGAGVGPEDALDAWRRDVERQRPFPKPAPPVEPPPEFLLAEGLILMSGPASDVPPVEPRVANTPCVRISVRDLPSDRPRLGAWIRLVGAHGTTFPAALQHEPEGFTLVGDRLLERLDLDALEARLAHADRDALPLPEVPWDLPFERPARDARVRTYRLVDERTGAEVTPSVSRCTWTARFQPGDLDGDALRWMVVRQRFEV